MTFLRPNNNYNISHLIGNDCCKGYSYFIQSKNNVVGPFIVLKIGELLINKSIKSISCLIMKFISVVALSSLAFACSMTDPGLGETCAVENGSCLDCQNSMAASEISVISSKPPSLDIYNGWNALNTPNGQVLRFGNGTAVKDGLNSTYTTRVQLAGYNPALEVTMRAHWKLSGSPKANTPTFRVVAEGKTQLEASKKQDSVFQKFILCGKNIDVFSLSNYLDYICC